MQPWKFFLKKVPGLPGRGIPPKLSFVKGTNRVGRGGWDRHINSFKKVNVSGTENSSNAMISYLLSL